MRKYFVTFISIYLAGLVFLFLFKIIMGYPNYVIPGPKYIVSNFTLPISSYLDAILITFAVAISGHIIAIFLAFVVAITVVISKRLGSIVKSVALTLQAYPIIAIAPVIFIIFGDKLFSRLAITISICYFPMLLTLVGVLSKRVPEVEHFFHSCKKLGTRDIIKIRISENLNSVITTIIGSSSLAVVGSIVAEFLASNSGIGYVIRVALDRNKMVPILFSLLIIGIANWLYISLLEWLGKNSIRKILNPDSI